MKKFEVRYKFDGGKWYQVISAESAGQAVDFLLSEDGDREIIGVKETNEDPDIIVPAGWQRPAPPAPLKDEEIEIFRLYGDWAFARCVELDLDPEDCDVDFDTWLREVYHAS